MIVLEQIHCGPPVVFVFSDGSEWILPSSVRAVQDSAHWYWLCFLMDWPGQSIRIGMRQQAIGEFIDNLLNRANAIADVGG